MKAKKSQNINLGICIGRDSHLSSPPEERWGQRLSFLERILGAHYLSGGR